MSDERERLFQLFHDLVDEALVQYADGFAVDLESRYYELADTLIAERAALEQQLAQAQNDAEHYAEIAQGDELHLCELQEQLAEAQARLAIAEREHPTLYELADENERLGEERDQAQAENEQLEADKHFLLLRNDALQAEQATMRGLLAQTCADARRCSLVVLGIVLLLLLLRLVLVIWRDVRTFRRDFPK